MFEDMMNDKLTVQKANGEKTMDLFGSVQGDRVFLMQATPVIEPGDEIWRHASNGSTQRYVVVDPGFSEGLGSIPPHYQMTVKKWEATSAVAQSAAAAGLYVTINGHNARVNHASTDNSVNIINDNSGSSDLIAELRRLIDQAALPEAEREAAHEVASEIEEQFNSGKPRSRIVSALVNLLPPIATLSEAGTKLIALASGVST